MNSREFVYWLQGFLEISRTDSISVDQLKKIHEQLMLVDDSYRWTSLDLTNLKPITGYGDSVIYDNNYFNIQGT